MLYLQLKTVERIHVTSILECEVMKDSGDYTFCCLFIGAAYVSSSSGTAPTSSHSLPQNTIDALRRLGLAVGESDTQLDATVLSVDRGHPVGGAVASGLSGTMGASRLPDDLFAEQSRVSFMNSGQFPFQLVSTPMVRHNVSVSRAFSIHNSLQTICKNGGQYHVEWQTFEKKIK